MGAKKKPVGWRGDSERHALARRGIKSAPQISPRPQQALDRSVIESISRIRRLKAAKHSAIKKRDLDSSERINKQIRMQEAYLQSILKISQLELMEVNGR